MPRPRIMFIQRAGDSDGRIARVTFSKTGRTVCCDGKSFVAIGGRGVVGNHMDEVTFEEYWISGPHKDGLDTLFSGSVHIDDDVREEYWRAIRNVGLIRFRRRLLRGGYDVKDEAREAEAARTSPVHG